MEYKLFMLPLALQRGANILQWSKLRPIQTGSKTSQNIIQQFCKEKKTVIRQFMGWPNKPVKPQEAQAKLAYVIRSQVNLHTLRNLHVI